MTLGKEVFCANWCIWNISGEDASKLMFTSCLCFWNGSRWQEDLADIHEHYLNCSGMATDDCYIHTVKPKIAPSSHNPVNQNGQYGETDHLNVV